MGGRYARNRNQSGVTPFLGYFGVPVGVHWGEFEIFLYVEGSSLFSILFSLFFFSLLVLLFVIIGESLK